MKSVKNPLRISKERLVKCGSKRDEIAAWLESNRFVEWINWDEKESLDAEYLINLAQWAYLRSNDRRVIQEAIKERRLTIDETWRVHFTIESTHIIFSDAKKTAIKGDHITSVFSPREQKQKWAVLRPKI